MTTLTNATVDRRTRRSGLGALLLGVVVSLFVTFAQAQTAVTGSITGRVLNPATGEYIRNAEVKIQGSTQVAISEDGGYFHLYNVPAGQAMLTATYTGHQTAQAMVTVTAGGTATQDFELAPSTGAVPAGDQVVKLGAFVVESEREGQAKAVSEQKTAMNVKTVMAAENFGDMSEGNIGEFLKYMPGVVIDYVETDTRSAGLGGMDPKYGYVTLDGNTQASGSSGAFSDTGRQFEFESISMNNIESIEMNKTLSADMSADAPAGTVNLRTRSALDRKQAKYGFSVGLITNSLEAGFAKTPRHDDARHAKTRPRFSFDYTNNFFDRKLGITLNGAFTNIYKEQFRETLVYDYTSSQAVAAGRPLLTSIQFKDGPKIVEKNAGGIKVEYQPFRGLRMSGAVSYAWFNDFFANRNLQFNSTAANLDIANSSLTKIVTKPVTNTSTRIDQSGESTGKLKDQTTLTYMANYKNGPWTTDLSLTYSRQRESRGGLAYGTMGRTDVRLGKIAFTAERPSVESGAWSIVQTAGPNWFDYNNYGRDTGQDQISDEVYGKTEEYTGKLDVKRAMSWSIPTFYKAGISERVTFRHRNTLEYFQGRYVGTTGDALNAPMPQSKAQFLIDKGFGGGLYGLPVPDKEAMFALMRTHPEQFTRSEANLATELDKLLGSYQGNQEDIRAGYLMQESRLGKWRLQAGLRYENTRTISRVPDEVPVNDNPFATRGTTTISGVVRPTFRATASRDYVNYQYSRGLITSWGTYDDWLPSAQARYEFTKDFSMKLGYNKAIKRPNLNRIAGPWEIDYDNNTGQTTVTIPNPELKPERSDKYSVMFEYYFEPAGQLSMHLFQTDITGAADETEPIPAADFGFGDDPNLADAYFVTFLNLNQMRRHRGIELSYSQQLTFFRNELLRGLSVFATYSQFTATPRPRNATRFVPRTATGGVNWKYRKFSVGVNGTWTDETFVSSSSGADNVSGNSLYTPNAPSYLRPRLIMFVNASYKLNRNLSVFMSGDRAYDSGKIWYFKSDGRMRQTENYGSQWSLGLKGDF